MKFTVSTKPLISAIDLGIIKENISKFNQKSGIAQLTASRDTLRINIEAPRIVTEMTLRGSGDSDETLTVFVDCVSFKSLIDTFETDVTTLEYVENGLILHSGSGKFTLPTLSSPAGAELDRPAQPSGTDTITISKESWDFVKSHQMFAISIWMIHPVYTRVYVGSSGDVIVGDIDNSIFTLSHKSNFPNTMLLKPSIINLFTTLPEGAVVYPQDDSFIIDVTTDSYSLRTQFTPEYESDEGVGSYNSETILPVLQPAASYIEVPVAPVIKFINQSEILTSGSDNSISIKLEGTQLVIAYESSKFTVDVPKVGEVNNFNGEFKSAFFKPVFTGIDGDTVKISPVFDENESLNSCIFWTDNMSIVMGCSD